MDGVSSRVVRIPAAGPSPFNTLVNVHCARPGTGILTQHSGTSKALITVTTDFLLLGFDPYNPPPNPYPYHSTTVVLQALSLSDDTSFTMAIDAVSAHFADDGHWTVTADTTLSISYSTFTTRWETLTPVLSSWVLCYEPPPLPPPPLPPPPRIKLVGSLAEAFGDIGAR